MATRPSNVDAEYRGEWIVSERQFSVTLDSKTYSWEIEGEIPAMRYSVDGGEHELGPADWVNDSGTVKFDIPEQFRNSPVSTAKKGTKFDLFVAVSEAAVDTKNEYDSHVAARNATESFAKSFGMDGSSRGSRFALKAVEASHRYTIASETHKKQAWERAGRKADARKAKKERMPGWPAINFRRGKKSGKGASATKKAATNVEGVFMMDDEDSVASFEMTDGTIKELSARGIAIGLKIDGKQVWSTETLFVPMEDGTKVPPGVYAVGYCSALAREVVSYYVEFVAGKAGKSEQRGVLLFDAI